MSKAPWFKFWAADFLAHNDVRAMTAEQVGWYCLMLIGSWNNTPRGYITSDQHLLSVCCHCVDHTYFKDHAALVLKQFQTTTDGLWYYHPRILEQADNLPQIIEKKSKAGKASAEKRKKKVLPVCSTPVEQVLLESESESEKEQQPKNLTLREQALAICQIAILPATNSNLDVVQASIEALAAGKKIAMDEASNKILAEVEKKINNGERLNRFWFENGGYVEKPAEPAKPKLLTLMERVRKQDEDDARRSREFSEAAARVN